MSLYRAIFTVGGFTMISRVTGFLRDIMIAALLGAGPIADAFFVAFKLPNFFRRLTAEGSFTVAFIPLFAGLLEEEGRDAALRFAAEVVAVLTTIVLALTLLIEITMPWVIKIIIMPRLESPMVLKTAISDFLSLTIITKLESKLKAAMQINNDNTSVIIVFSIAMALKNAENFCVQS